LTEDPGHNPSEEKNRRASGQPPQNLKWRKRHRRQTDPNTDTAFHETSRRTSVPRHDSTEDASGRTNPSALPGGKNNKI